MNGWMDGLIVVRTMPYHPRLWGAGIPRPPAHSRSQRGPPAAVSIEVDSYPLHLTSSMGLFCLSLLLPAPTPLFLNESQ